MDLTTLKWENKSSANPGAPKEPMLDIKPIKDLSNMAKVSVPNKMPLILHRESYERD